MVSNFHLPPVGYGPGSQPPDEDEQALEYLPMPQDMRSYSAHVPEITAAATLEPAFALLRDIAQAAEAASQGRANTRFDLSGLDRENRALIAETMGEGEVSIKMHGRPAIAAQESVFAGVWCLRGAEIDAIEVGPVPNIAIEHAFVPRTPATADQTPQQPGVVNAPPLLVELADKSASWSEEAEPHVVNLTLLPHTEQDLDWLDHALGAGSVEILSRGYGNCRVTATATPRVWRVQFYNSMDTLILDTFEVTGMPEVALAASEDLADSGARILEVLEAIR